MLRSVNLEPFQNLKRPGNLLSEDNRTIASPMSSTNNGGSHFSNLPEEAHQLRRTGNGRIAKHKTMALGCELSSCRDPSGGGFTLSSLGAGNENALAIPVGVRPAFGIWYRASTITSCLMDGPVSEKTGRVHCAACVRGGIAFGLDCGSLYSMSAQDYVLLAWQVWWEKAKPNKMDP